MSRWVVIWRMAVALSGVLLSDSALAGPAELTAANAELWLDGYMRAGLSSAGVPGAVVSIVKDGRVLLAKGYGLADISSQRPVDAHTTLFRVGSVTKLFTWTAVMQLVEQRRIDLDADINQYLDFVVPAFDGQFITMRHLMTHTAGFEEAKRGLATEQTERLIPLAEAVKRDLPARVYPPGKTPAYSNYGAALAAYIVERRSGEPFAAYVARHIFQPLGMERSSFEQPLPKPLAQDAALGYMSPFIAPGKFELVNWAPAGGLSSTGEDMARFMLAHLQGGAADRPHVLSADTLRVMHDSPTTFIPSLNRSTLGFAEREVNGRRAIGHDGDTVLFHSLLGLYPQHGVGLFVSFNSPGVQGAVWPLRDQLFADFSERFLPANAAVAGNVVPEIAQQHASMFASAYVTSRSSVTGFMKAKKLLLPVKVLQHADGTISLSGLRGISGELKRFREVAPLLWHEVGGYDRLAAIATDGRITRLSVNDVSATAVFDAVPVWMSPTWLLPAFVIALLTLIVSLAAWPVGAMLPRRYGASLQLSPLRRRADLLSRGSFVLAVLATTGWAWLFMQALDPVRSYLLSEHDGAILLIEGLTLIGFLGACAAALFRAFVAWKEPSTWMTRLGSVTLVAAAFVLVYTAALYNLMSFSLAY